MLLQMICMASSAMFELYLLYDFFHGIFEYRERFEKLGCRMLWSAFLILISIGMSLFAQNAVTLLTGIVTSLLFVLCIFEGNIRQKIYDWFLLWFLMAFVEYLFTVLMKLNYREFAEAMYGSEFHMIFIILIVKMITFIVYLFIKRSIPIVPHYMDRRAFFLYMLLPVSTVGILFSVVYVSRDIYEVTAGNLVLVLFSVLAFIADILLYYVYNRYAALTEQSRYQEQQILRFHALQDNYENLEGERGHYQELLHDMKHYLMLIGEYAEEEKNGDILRVLQELQLEINTQEHTIYCENKLFNRILLDCRKKTEDAGSSFRVICDPGFSLPAMRDMDMFNLFGNLFDNAVEAVQKAAHGSIEVEMRMRREGRIAIVKIKNTYDGELKMEDGRIQTGKKDKDMHGIGLRSAEKIVKKYHGIFQVKAERDFFRTDLMFYL